MSFSFSTLRQELATALETIVGLNVSAYRPTPMLSTPCAFIIPKNITYGYTLPGFNQRNFFNVQLLISRAMDLKESQSRIDEYLSVTGTTSIMQAISNGTYTDVSSVHCNTMDQYGGFMYDGTQYFGALFTVEVY